jgi:hypothetical protein
LNVSSNAASTSPDRLFHIELDDAVTNAVTYLQRLTHTTTGTPANGIAVGKEWEVETAAGVNKIGMTEYVTAVDVTPGSEDFSYSQEIMADGVGGTGFYFFQPNNSAGWYFSPNAVAPPIYFVSYNHAGCAFTCWTRPAGGVAATDSIGKLLFWGQDSTPSTWAFAEIEAKCVTASTSIPDGSLDLRILLAGGEHLSRVMLTDNVRIGDSGAAGQRTLHVTRDNATNNAVTYLERLTHTTSGTPAAGIGVGLEFEAETSASNNEIGITLEAVAYTATAGVENFCLNLKQMALGTLQESQGLNVLIRSLTANTAYTNNNSVQNWFSTSPGITVEAGTTYLIEGQLLQTPGTTSHTVALTFGLSGGATLTSIAYSAWFAPSLVNAVITTSAFTQVTQATTTVVTPAVTTAGTIIRIYGLMRVNAGGVVTPQFTFSAAPGAGNNLIGTFFKLQKIGTNTNTIQGPWA